jgi:arabinan endo-1,5-alpha-L-arabinosidase
MNRRDFLKGTLATLGLSSLPITIAQDATEFWQVKGAILNVHDPVIIKQDDYYYLFSTGTGVHTKRSADFVDWRIAQGYPVFSRMPEEAAAHVPSARDIWAPDISYYNDRYHLYYSVSTFGSSQSAIGLATTPTLHSDDENFGWTDHGIVVQSTSSSNFNAIDANLVLDADNEPWLVFGSHWSGIKMIKLDYDTGKQSEDDTTLYDIASRAIHPRAIEAPFIIYRNGYYYLFVSFDQCCSGIRSTYNVRVGRAESITGPYIDRDGVDMMRDGGTQITFDKGRYVGPGHNAIFHEDGQDWIIYHAYDKVQGGTPTLRVNRLEWDDEDWCYIPFMETEA